MNAATNHRPPVASNRRPERSEGGFTMIETLVALMLLLIVMGGVMESMLRFSRTQTTVWNRANMHASVRSATELLQQEVGQAGRVALPTAVGMSSTVTTPGPQTVTVSSTTGMFAGERLVIDAGQSEETVTVISVDSGTAFSASFLVPHAPTGGNPIPVAAQGGFASGVVPCADQASCPGSSVTTSLANGSTSSVLKIYGDLNGDGNMVYVEYVCDTTGGNLYRNMMPMFSTSKSGPTADQVLLSNLLPNPGGTPCFTYEQKTVNGAAYVLNVAISLTTQTQLKDPVTGQFQTETKALLNVAPRNVFDVWQLASIGVGNRIQPMPPTVANLIHD